MERDAIFVNGISTELIEAHKLAEELESLTHLSIKLFYNPADGAFTDLLECLWSRYLGFFKPRVFTQRLASEIKWTLQHLSKDKDLHIFAHSQGCMVVMNALHTLPKEKLSRIHVHLFAVTNLYQVDGLKHCESFLNEDDYVVANLVIGATLARIWRRLIKFWINKKDNRGPIYYRREGGHALKESYLDVISEFHGYTESDLYHLARS